MQSCVIPRCHPWRQCLNLLFLLVAVQYTSNSTSSNSSPLYCSSYSYCHFVSSSFSVFFFVSFVLPFCSSASSSSSLCASSSACFETSCGICQTTQGDLHALGVQLPSCARERSACRWTSSPCPVCDRFLGYDVPNPNQEPDCTVLVTIWAPVVATFMVSLLRSGTLAPFA